MVTQISCVLFHITFVFIKVESGELVVKYLALNYRDFTKMASVDAPFYVIKVP